MSARRQEVCRLLVEGLSQSQIAATKGYGKSTICQAASWLEGQGFISKLTKGTPRLYGPGPRYNIVREIVERIGSETSTLTEMPAHATGVTRISKSTYKVNTLTSHHIKARARVEKIGDREYLCVGEGGERVRMPFLESAPYLDHNNVQRYRGSLTIGGERFSMELEETIRRSTLYVHLPSRELTQAEAPGWKRIFTEIAQRAFDFVTKWGGWKLGEVELCKNWKPHFASEESRLLGYRLNGITASSPDGSVWLSNSGGSREIETSEPEYAQFICSLPESYLDMSRRVSVLLEFSRKLLETIENLMKIEASRLEKELVHAGMGK